MKTIFCATVAAIGFGIGSAHADGGGQGPTLFTMIEAQLAAKAQGRSSVQAAPATGVPTYVYSARPHSQGTWLFAPTDGGGANN